MKLHIGTILTVIGLSGSIVMGYTGLYSRVSVLEEVVKNIKEDNKKYQEVNSQQLADFLTGLQVNYTITPKKNARK